MKKLLLLVLMSGIDHLCIWPGPKSSQARQGGVG